MRRVLTCVAVLAPLLASCQGPAAPEHTGVVKTDSDRRPKLLTKQRKPAWRTGEPIDDGEVALISNAVRKRLPNGCRLIRVERARTPDHWHTFDKRGLLVEGEHAESTFSIWFLPVDWVGIGEPAERRCHEKVYVGRPSPEAVAVIGAPPSAGSPTKVCKAVVRSSIPNVHSLPRLLRMRVCDLGGADELFAGRYSEACAEAQRLIEKHCHDEGSLHLAIKTLARLGVPAKTVFLKGAGHRSEEVSVTSLYALGYLGGQDVVRLASSILENPRASTRRIVAAAHVAQQVNDAAAGPSLLKALDHAKGDEPRTNIVRAIESLGYAAAAPRILGLIDEIGNPHYVRYCTKALATFRYEEAVPRIRKLADGEDVRNRGRGGRSLQYHHGIQLLRLTGPWSEPVGDTRILLMAADEYLLGRPIKIDIVFEFGNTGDGPGWDEVLDGTLVLNGVRVRREVGGWSGWLRGPPNDAGPWPYDIADAITRPGTYTARWEARGMVTNEVTFEVK